MEPQQARIFPLYSAIEYKGGEGAEQDQCKCICAALQENMNKTNSLSFNEGRLRCHLCIWTRCYIRSECIHMR